MNNKSGVRSKLFFLTGASVSVAALIALSACEVPAGKSKGGDNDSASASCDGSGSEPSCYTEKLHQPDGHGSGALDLLFVTDTSDGLNDDRHKVAEGIESFVNTLPKGTDIQIAVMLAHGSHSQYSGQFYRHDASTPYVFSGLKSSLDKIGDGLEHVLTHTASDPYSDGGREGLYSYDRGIGINLDANRAKGFFRSNTPLAVVFISDHDDVCAVYPAGVSHPDADDLSPTTLKDCNGVTPASILKKTQALQGTTPFVFGAIVHTQRDDDDEDSDGGYGRCGRSEHAGGHERHHEYSDGTYAWGYLDLIQISNGVSVDIDSESYNEGLSKIAKLVSAKSDLVHDFKLGHDQVDPSTLKVRVDGKDAKFKFDHDSNQIHLDDVGDGKSEIEVGYCQVPAPSPSASPAPSGAPSPSGTPSPAPSASPTVTPSPTPSPSASPTVTPSPTPSPSPSASPTVTPTPTPSPSASPTVTPSPSPTPSASPSPDPSASPTATPSPSPTPSASPSPDPTPCTGPGCDGGLVGV